MRRATAAQIRVALLNRQVRISQRNVQYLLERYDELVALSVRNSPERRAQLEVQGRLILAIDGRQPDVGHEVLWVIREVLSGQVLLARSRLSSRQADLIELLREALGGLTVPVVGVISDGQHSIRKAVAKAFPGVPHQLCQFHYWKQAAAPAWEADRHAKKELKKHLRTIRPIERAVSDRDDDEAQVIQWYYCAAVRSAMTERRRWSRADCGCMSAWSRSKPACSALRKKGGLPTPLQRLSTILSRPLTATAALWPPLQQMFAWLHEAVDLLDNPEQRSGAVVQAADERLSQHFAAQLKSAAGEPMRRWGEHLLKITNSDWAGLLHTDDVADLPRTNNDLEHLFGSLRHQERRITGRKVASSSLVTRGAVRVFAAVLAWVSPPTPSQLGEVDPGVWHEERRRLGKRRHARLLQRRFRQQPDRYLAGLEEQLLKLDLPP